MIFQKMIEQRIDSDSTQSDIAKILGISQQAYSLWETGDKIIPLKHLNTLCNYYNVSMDYLVGLSNTKHYDVISKKLDRIKIGKRLKLFREKHKIKQIKLANLLNTSHSTISAYEHGKTLILTAFAYQIAKKFGVSMDWLCCRID